MFVCVYQYISMKNNAFIINKLATTIIKNIGKSNVHILNLLEY